jgi:hypothetical protein
MLDLARAIQRPNVDVPFAREGVAGGASAAAPVDADGNAELLNFLDDVLQPGSQFVDFAPGDGTALLIASSVPSGGVRGLAISGDAAQCQQLNTAIADRALQSMATVRFDATDAISLDTLTAGELAGAAPLIVYAGDANVIPWLAKGALESIRASRIAVIAWRCVQASASDAGAARDADIAGTVLAVLGFEHFALVERNDEIELVPLSAVATNTIVFSVSPAQRAQWAA